LRLSLRYSLPFVWPLITPWVSSNWSYTFVVMGWNSQLGQLLINSITHECV
jgi:hypothetical protein